MFLLAYINPANKKDQYVKQPAMLKQIMLSRQKFGIFCTILRLGFRQFHSAAVPNSKFRGLKFTMVHDHDESRGYGTICWRKQIQ